MEEMRYLTFALGKGRLAKKTLEMFETDRHNLRGDEGQRHQKTDLCK